jgi:hypothetical protein
VSLVIPPWVTKNRSEISRYFTAYPFTPEKNKFSFLNNFNLYKRSPFVAKCMLTSLLFLKSFKSFGK